MTPPVLRAVVVRNAVVLSLAAGLAALLRLPEGVFLALATLMTLEGSVGQGRVAGRERILGTLCGGAVCVLVLGLLGTTGVPAATLGLLLVRLMGHGLGLASGFIVGGHVVAGSVANHSADWLPFVLLRTGETLGGVLLGVLAARWILPVRAGTRLQQELAGWRSELAGTLRAGVGTGGPERLTQLRGKRDQLLDQLRFAREELPASPAGRALERHWDRQLFHGAAVLGCLRDLRQAEAGIPADLRQACQALLERGADLLEERGGPAEVRAAALELRGLCDGLEGEVERLDPAGRDRLALVVHRAGLLALHAEAMAGGPNDQPSPPERKRSIR